MARNVESPAHYQLRVTLKDLILRIRSLEVDEFDLQQLKDLNVHVEHITLDEASTSTSKPSYFAPYPAHLIPEPDDDALGGAYKGLDGDTELSLTRPADRAYGIDRHFSAYISYCDRKLKGKRFPWTSKW